MYVQSRVHQGSRKKERNKGWWSYSTDDQLIQAFPQDKVTDCTTLYQYIEKHSPKVFIYYTIRSMPIAEISEALGLDGSIIRRILESRCVRLRRREGRGW